MMKKKIIILGLSLCLTACTNIDTNKIEANVTTPETTNNTPATKVDDIILDNGNYTSGIDFTPGTYTITAIEGNGNVISSNSFSGGINAMMGIGGDGLNELFQKEYKNIKLPKDTVLEIKNVKINLKFIR